MKGFLKPHHRLIYAFLSGLLISYIQSIALLLGLSLLVVLLVVFLHSHQPKHLMKRWFQFNIFSVLVWATLSWKIGSDGIELNMYGAELALLITLRMNLIVMSIWLFMHHVTDTILVQAIAELPLPKKLKHLFILTVRYISLLGELNHKMDIAMKARGFQPKCNFYTMKVYSQRVALLLIHAMLKAESAERAMKARGFRF
ncbi:ABC transporter permease [Pasteurellaceae bacterium LFhippo2]|nr:ABC transporter permease [Pasteurellaceae bacterium LFhippo2]